MMKMKFGCDPFRNRRYAIWIRIITIVVLIQQLSRSSDGARTVITSHLVILPRGGNNNSRCNSNSSHRQQQHPTDPFAHSHPPVSSPQHGSSSSPFTTLTLGDIESVYNDDDNSNKSRLPEDTTARRRQQQRPLLPIWVRATAALDEMVPKTMQYTHQLYQEYPVLVTITATCVVIWMAWHVRIPSFQQNVMQPYFICRRSSPWTIRYGTTTTIVSLLLSAVSHIDIFHLMYNLMAFLSLGPVVQQSLARNVASRVDTTMWQLVTGAALSGSVAYLILPTRGSAGGGGGGGGGCLGLSTVTMAMLSMFALAHPERVLQTRIFNLVPIRMPAIRLLLLTLVGSVLGCILPLISKYHDNISHSGHLGGLLFGVAFYDIVIMDRPPFLHYIGTIRRYMNDSL